jgi:hypothetical protein
MRATRATLLRVASVGRKAVRALALVAGVVLWWIAVGQLWQGLAAPANPPDAGPPVAGAGLLTLLVAGILILGRRGTTRSSPRQNDASARSRDAG